MPKNATFLSLRGAGALSAGVLALSLYGSSVQADPVDDSIAGEITIAEEGARSQQTIDSLDQQAEQLLSEYRQVVAETESLKIYNEQLARIVNNQQEEIDSIQRQIDGLEDTTRDIVPLLKDMVERFGQLVESDIPFRIQERRDRYYGLQDLMDRSDITDSERYRRVMEAYQIELDYGRNTATYRGDLPGDGPTVDFLKVGRLLLIYQSLDGREVGWFNPKTREFESLPQKYASAIEDGIAIASSQAAPDIVRLPVIAPDSE